MSIGPVEYIAIAFPGSKFSGAIVPAIKELQDAGTIQVLDLVIISKDAEGNVAAIELSEASPEEAARPCRPRDPEQEPARPGGLRGHRRCPRPEQHRRV